MERYNQDRDSSQARDSGRSYDNQQDQGQPQGDSGYSRSNQHGGQGNHGYSGQGQGSGQGYGSGQSGDSQLGGSQFGGGQATQQRRGKAPKNYTCSDERLQELVCDTLVDRGCDCSEVEVEVKEGVVNLSGIVHERSEKHEFEMICADINGVQNVENKLRVDRDGSQSGGQSGSKSDSESGSGK